MAATACFDFASPGTNCDEETAHAFALAGGAPERWHVQRVLEEPRRVAEFQVLCIPGGFSYGDDIAAGRILGSQMRHHLADMLAEFHASRQTDPRHLQRFSGADEDGSADAGR